MQIRICIHNPVVHSVLLAIHFVQRDEAPVHSALEGNRSLWTEPALAASFYSIRH